MVGPGIAPLYVSARTLIVPETIGLKAVAREVVRVISNTAKPGGPVYVPPLGVR